MSIWKTLRAALTGTQRKIECRRYEAARDIVRLGIEHGAKRKARTGKALEPTAHQNTIQARVIRKLMSDGWIDARTVLHMGTTDAHKMFTRLRRLGVLHDANDPTGYVLVPNHSGQSCFRRHKWTGKRPAGWPEPERRKVKRGGR